MAAWNLAGAIEAASTNSKPEDFVYKISGRLNIDCPHMSAKTLEAAKMMCGSREVVSLNGEIVWDPTMNRLWKERNAKVARATRLVRASR